MQHKLFFVILGLVTLAVASGLTYWFYQPPQFTSPLNEFTHSKFFRHFTPAETKSSDTQIIYGFLPYWNLEQAQLPEQLTHLAYFGLTISPQGEMVTTTAEGYTDPGYQQLQGDQLLTLSQEIKARDGQFELVLTLFDNDQIASLLSHPETHDKFLQSLHSLLLAYPLDGLNLDIEYSGTADETLRHQFTAFVTKIRQYLQINHPQIQFSLDIYAAAASKKMIWDLVQLEPEVDRFIIMAYDFHRPNSPQAGPVAPLFGSQENWATDINHNLATLSQLLPKEKMLLGIPFYGYQWQTTSRDSQAHTYPQTGETMTLEDVQDLLKPEVQAQYQVEEHWHQAALSPYLTYTKNEKNYVVYYENSRSLSYKLDYVHRLDLAGIALWALGYEDNQGKLWSVIEQSLN